MMGIEIILRAHAPRHAMGEVGTVDDDEDVRRSRYHGSSRSPDQPQDLWQLRDDRGKPDDRELLDRKQRVQSLARHGAAADAFELDGAAEPLAQHFHEARPEPVAGFFGGDQENPPPDACYRPRRAHAATPTMNKPALSAASIMACASAAIVLPATTAIPASPAFAAPSTVRGPMVGRS